MKKSIPLMLLLALGLSSCGKEEASTQQPPQTTYDELLARIGQLETENNQLKKELEQYKGGVEANAVNETIPVENQTQEEQASATGEKMIGGEEKGAGSVALMNASGQGNHITIIQETNAIMHQIGITFEEVDTNGSEPTTIYVDGKENSVVQVSKDVQKASSITLEDAQLEKGMHNVEVIQEINGEQTFYRLLTYEVK